MKTKRLIGALLSASVFCSAFCIAAPASAATHPNLLAGDANGDGVVNIRDVTEIQRLLASGTEPDEQTVQVAKTDFAHENLTIEDATNIQRYLAEYDDRNTREVGKAAFIWRSNKYRPALEEYQRYLDQNLSSFAFNGAAYVTRNGRVLAQSAVGTANTAEGKAVEMDTLFPIGSVSKQFCAASVMLLQERGKLSVSDKLSKYFPEYEIGKNITLHQMLSMRSGIRDYVNTDSSYAGHENPIDEFTLSEDKTDEENRQIVLDWLFGENLKFTPDKGWSYSNSNYMLLAMIVEKASGEDYHSFVRENIFEPLGMSNSSFCADTLGDPRVCEDSSGEDFDSLPYVYKWAYLNTKGDGDIVSNAADIDKWLGSLREGTILSKESIAAMTTNYSGTNNYGYGLSLDGDIVYHGGDISTFESAALTVPGDNINIFIVTNNAQAAWDKNLSISTVALRVAKKVLG